MFEMLVEQMRYKLMKKRKSEKVISRHRRSLQRYIDDNFEGGWPEKDECAVCESTFSGDEEAIIFGNVPEENAVFDIEDTDETSEAPASARTPQAPQALQAPSFLEKPEASRRRPSSPAIDEDAKCPTLAAPKAAKRPPLPAAKRPAEVSGAAPMYSAPAMHRKEDLQHTGELPYNFDDLEQELRLKRELNERMKHLSDTFSEYLLFLIKQQGMTNSEVWNRACVDKKVFSKIKNNVNYHPQKRTAMQLCVGARLNLDNTKDLLARAGYALSPSEMQDVIFSYFIENEIFDILEIDIMLEEYGLPCIIE